MRIVFNNMNKLNTLNRNSALPISVVLIATLLVWTLGLSTWINYAHAQLTSVKDTLSDSDLSVASKHVISFTTASAVAAAGTIKIQLDPATSLFTEAFSSATTTDITVTGMTLVSACGAPDAEVTVAGNYNGGSDENLTFTVCAGDTVTAGAKVVTVGASTLLWTNPGVAASYQIKITAGSDTDSARVAIIDDVTVTAAVDTTLTFTISGVASGQANANGEAGNTDVTTTSTSIPWGTLAADTAKEARQDLALTTNAAAGFTVTLFQDQNLTSASNADIDKFKDGVDGAAAAWASPTGTLGTENSYGHMGVTSEDATLVGGDTFGSALYDALGVSATPLEVFYHDGPADGSTANKGATKIGFKIQVSGLQEAGTDYTNTLTYIATPIF